MKWFCLLSIFILSCGYVKSQTVDTLYNQDGSIKAYGEKRNGKRYGVWYFDFRKGKSYKTINYLKDGRALVKYYSDEDEIWGVDQDAMTLYPYNKIENNTFYLSEYYNAKYNLKDYEVIFDGTAYYYYASTGVLLTGIFKDGKLYGEWKKNYPSGYIMNRKNFVNGKLDGKWITYYEEPKMQIWVEGQYKDNAKAGTWKTYYPNGQLKKEGAFNVDIKAVYITDENIDSLQVLFPDTELKYYQMAKFPFNFKSGCWKYYSKEGSLTKTEYYKKGQLIKSE